MTDAASTGNAAFATAAEEATKLATAPGQSDMLDLYALFKQGIFGDNNTTRPGMMDFKGKAKWDAWDSKKGMSKEDAQQKYIELVERLKSA